MLAGHWTKWLVLRPSLEFLSTQNVFPDWQCISGLAELFSVVFRATPAMVSAVYGQREVPSRWR